MGRFALGRLQLGIALFSGHGWWCLEMRRMCVCRAVGVAPGGCRIDLHGHRFLVFVCVMVGAAVLTRPPAGWLRVAHCRLLSFGLICYYVRLFLVGMCLAAIIVSELLQDSITPLPPGSSFPYGV